jgi:hypothetical protein
MAASQLLPMRLTRYRLRFRSSSRQESTGSIQIVDVRMRCGGFIAAHLTAATCASVAVNAAHVLSRTSWPEPAREGRNR